MVKSTVVNDDSISNGNTAVGTSNANLLLTSDGGLTNGVPSGVTIGTINETNTIAGSGATIDVTTGLTSDTNALLNNIGVTNDTNPILGSGDATSPRNALLNDTITNGVPNDSTIEANNGDARESWHQFLNSIEWPSETEGTTTRNLGLENTSDENDVATSEDNGVTTEVKIDEADTQVNNNTEDIIGDEFTEFSTSSLDHCDFKTQETFEAVTSDLPQNNIVTTTAAANDEFEFTSQTTTWTASTLDQIRDTYGDRQHHPITVQNWDLELNGRSAIRELQYDLIHFKQRMYRAARRVHERFAELEFKVWDLEEEIYED